MKLLSKVLMIVSIGHSLVLFELGCCTRLFWNNNKQAKVVARTMDLFISDEPQMWINPRGVHHHSKVDDNGLEWISLYGNVSISAFHEQDNTTDGLNEQGFAVHALALPGTQYEKRDARPGVHLGEWLQYLLDTCRTVQEARDLHSHFQVVPIALNGFAWPLHLMMEDATGDSAIIEFVEGQMKVYHGSQYQVGTNAPPYDQQLKNLELYEKFGGTHPLPTKTDSMGRFVLASTYLKELPEPKSSNEAITLFRDTIAKVFQKDNVYKNLGVNVMGDELKISTLWTIIADLTHPTYYFFPIGQPHCIHLKLSELNFSAGSQIEEVSLLVSPCLGDVKEYRHQAKF